MGSSHQPADRSKPDQLQIEVHAALRALVHPHSKPDFSRLQRCLPHLLPADTALSAEGVRILFDRALEKMKTGYPDMFTLLRERFWEGRTMQELSINQGRSSSGLYAMQSQALRQLSKTISEMNAEAETHRAEAVNYRCRNLPPCPFQRLFGFEDFLVQIEKWLTDPQGPQIISLEGLGGLGKTALAYAAVREALASGPWADLAWVSAVDRPFYLWEAPDTPPPLNPDRIIQQIAEQLDLPEEVVNLPAEERRAAVKAALSEKPCLVVLEDLEPEHRPKDFLPNLITPTGPTRFILTSRQRLPMLPGCANLFLHELSRDACFEVMRYEAQERKMQISAADMEKVFALVGGNPMAMKLIIGQAVSLPLHRVLENLLPATKGTPAGNILQQIYRHSWKLLLPSARQVLFAMERFSPNGTGYDDLLTATNLSSKELDAALQQLVTHSLVVYNPSPVDLYTIHRLTYLFLWTLQRGGTINLIDTKPAAPPERLGGAGKKK
ncbi:MAG: hypothetical protein JW929_07810 [Anaerolineales bacterium]|nr:hypothetical protein [Anaerolineales bacterium]